MSGNWTDATKWSTGLVPGAGDDVIINVTGASSYTVTMNGDASIASLTLGAVSGATTQTLSMNGRALSLNSPSVVNTNGILSISGTLSGNGALIVNGAMNWPEGTITGGGALTVNGTLTVGGAWYLLSGRTLSGRTLTTANNTVWVSGNSSDIRLSNNAIWMNSGAFEIQTDSTLDLGDASAPQFTNSGTVRKTMGTGTATIDVSFVNTGTVQVSSGTLAMSRASTFGGTVTGSSALRFSAGIHTLNGVGIAGTGSAQVNGSSVLVSTTGAGATVAAGSTLQLASGTLSGAGPLTVDGTFDWAGGTITGIGALTVNGALTVGRTANVTLDGRNLTSTGAATWSANSIYLRNNAIWSNTETGTLEIQSDATLDLGDSSTPQFTNAGTVRKTALTGTTTIDVLFNTSGTVSAESGWMKFTRGFVQTTGSTILAGGNIATTGTLDIQGGTLSGVGTLDGNVSSAGQMSPGLSPGIMTITKNSTSGQGNYTQAAGGSLRIELGGTSLGSFDQVQLSGTSGVASLNGTLVVDLVGGFVPAIGNSFVILSVPNGSLAGDFSSVQFPSVPGIAFEKVLGQKDVWVNVVAPATITATHTSTSTATATDSPTATSSATPTSTATPTRTATRTPTNTDTPSSTPTQTRTFTVTATPVPSATPSSTASASATRTSTVTPTLPQSPTRTATTSSTQTPTRTSTATAIPTRTKTATASLTATSFPMCTPPLCGEDQLLYCPGSCPNGCGYTCATPTPTATPSATPRCPTSTVFFEENFDGTVLDPTHWTVFTNGYPAPAVSIAGGLVSVGQSGTTSLDFPYIVSAAPVFPAAGDFDLEVVMQYTGTAPNGDGFVVLGSANENILQVWNSGASGLGAELIHDSRTVVSDPADWHTYTLQIRGTTARLFIDGVQRATASLQARPTRLWFGHPTVAQTHSLEAYDWSPRCVDPATGTVLCRWWPTHAWSTFRVDSLVVRRPTFFEENFDEALLDPTKWSVFTNGYPTPAVSVASGSVNVGQAGISSLDFPYVTSVANPFPSSGDFTLEIAAQFTSTGGNGDGFVVLDAGNQVLFSVWNESGGPLSAGLGGSEWVSLSGATDLHRYRVEFSGGQASLFVDDTLKLTGPAAAVPVKIWMGHPTVGQVFDVDEVAKRPGEIDPSTGAVLSRWWTSGPWSTFQIDSIVVRQGCPASAPTSTPTQTATRTFTHTPTSTFTATRSPTQAPTGTLTRTRTVSPTTMATATPSQTPTLTQAPTCAAPTWSGKGPYRDQVAIDVRSLAVDPGTPSTVYAGTYDSGVYQSTDGGSTWAQSTTGLGNLTVNALAIDPSSPNVLYAGTRSGVYQSTDGGSSWTQRNNGLLNLDVRALAIDPSTPGTLYAGTDCAHMGSCGVYKSTDGGQSWTRRSNGIGSLDIHAVIVDSSNSSIVYAGGSGLYKSIDGGNNWTSRRSGLGSLDVHALAIDPSTPTILYAGTGGSGVYKSTNSASSWVQQSSGLGSSTVRALVIDSAAPDVLYAGTTGGGVLRSLSGGSFWSEWNEGLTTAYVPALAIGSPRAIYAGTPNGVFERQDVVCAATATPVPTPTPPSPTMIVVDCEQQNSLDSGNNCNWDRASRCCCWCPDPTGAHAWGHVMDLGSVYSEIDVHFELQPGAGDASCRTGGYIYGSIDGTNWSLIWSQENLAGYQTYTVDTRVAAPFRYVRANTDQCSVDWSLVRLAGGSLPSQTPTVTAVATAMPTLTAAQTPPLTPTAAATGTPSPVPTATRTSTPTPSGTPAATPIASATPTPFATPTPSATPTASVTPMNSPAVEIEMGTATGPAGSTARIAVTLHLISDVSVAGTENVITFHPHAQIAARSDGSPDCSANPEIRKNATAFAFDPPGCTPGAGCDRVRGLVLATDNVDAIPNGAPLYTCRVSIAPEASSGSYALTCSDALATDPSGELLSARCTDGAVIVGRSCTADCNADHQVTVNEIVKAVNIALGNMWVGNCSAADTNGDDAVTIDEIIGAVNRAMRGCM